MIDDEINYAASSGTACGIARNRSFPLFFGAPSSTFDFWAGNENFETPLVPLGTTPPTGCPAMRARAHDLVFGLGVCVGVGALFGVRAQVGVDEKPLVGVVDGKCTRGGV